MKTIIKLLAILAITLSTLASTASDALAATPQIETFHLEGRTKLDSAPAASLSSERTRRTFA